MQTDLCIEIYFTKFNYYDLIKENKLTLIKASVLEENSIENKTMLEEKKYEIFVLNRFVQKAQFFINELIYQFKENNKSFEPLSSFYDQFSIVNKEFNFTNTEFKYYFSKNLNVVSDQVSLESLQNFIAKYCFKIRVVDFIQITLISFISIFDFLESNITSVFDIFDTKKQGIFHFKEFTDAVNFIFKVPENDWKIKRITERD